jgi:uncharacterized protein YbjT (DUF2867 family)
MRVAVAGGTGRIGRFTIEALERAGHDAVPLSRAGGQDLYTGAGLDEALHGVQAVIDASNTQSQDEAEIVDFFGTATRNLLAAEQRAGVAHHVLLSIVGIDDKRTVPHYAGKRAQEELITGGPIPWTIVRATQFHDFPAMAAEWTVHDGVAIVAPLLLQPIAPRDVGDILADVAVSAPQRRRLDIAGPRTEDLVDMARRTFAARGTQLALHPTWRGPYDVSMSGEAMLPAADARLGPTTFDDWLASGAA